MDIKRALNRKQKVLRVDFIAHLPRFKITQNNYEECLLYILCPIYYFVQCENLTNYNRHQYTAGLEKNRVFQRKKQPTWVFWVL